MSTVPFVTCDLLDDNPEKDLQVVTPSMDGKFFKSYGARQTFGGQVVTVKCFEDNSRKRVIGYRWYREGIGCGWWCFNALCTYGRYDC